MRNSVIKRVTEETSVSVEMNLDGSGEYNIDTGVALFDHMLEQFSKHSGIDIDCQIEDCTYFDDHHIIEDAGIVIGQALLDCLGDKKGIERFGSALIPMDDALVQTAIDFCGRSYLSYNVVFPNMRLGDFDLENIREFFKSMADNAKMNIHINVLSGANNHHIAEAIFKSFAKAVNAAIKITGNELPTTKGVL